MPASGRKERKPLTTRTARSTASAIALLTLILLSGSLQILTASGAPSPALPSSARPIPPSQYPINPSNTPTATGCFRYDASRSSWIQQQCTPSSVSSSIPKPKEGGTAGVKGEASKNDVNYGYVQVFPYVPYGESDSGVGSGSYSLQANTNGFSVGGNNYVVQFTLQNDQSSGNDYLCIWTIDITTNDYNTDCQNLPNISLSSMSNGYMNGWAYGGLLGVQFCLNTRTDCWYTSESDSIGLESHWKGLTGTVLGYGASSKLTIFGGTATPYVHVLTGLYKPKSPFNSGEIGANTAETNNLHYTSTTTPTCASGWCTNWTYSS
ncbi:MAG: hypothetical protein OK474_06935 [Thaumarchaeota archaeon]|nr:hypothetical protein [Nitrososphaerota archaeon]